MKKIFAMLLALTLMLTFVACGGAASSSAPAPSSSAPASSAPASSSEAVSSETSSTPAAGDMSKYATILKDARTDEYNEAYAIVADGGYAHDPNSTPEADIAGAVDMLVEMTGFDVTNCEEYALSASLMNVKAYAVGIFKPAAGKEADVKASIEAYVAAQQKAFENYLPDQYENAKNAQVRTTESGEIILVMDDDAVAQADAIEAALKA